MNFKWTLEGKLLVLWLQFISMFSRIQKQLVQNTDSVAHTSSVKKVSLRISHNSHEKTCVEVCFFIKLQAESRKPTTLLKRDSRIQGIKNTYFEEHLQKPAAGNIGNYWNKKELWHKRWVFCRLLKKNINPFQPSVAFHIETSHFICTENQMTGFYMKCNIGLNWVKKNTVEKWAKVTVTILFITTFQKEITLKNRLKGYSTKKRSSLL